MQLQIYACKRYPEALQNFYIMALDIVSKIAVIQVNTRSVPIAGGLNKLVQSLGSKGPTSSRS